MNLHEITKPIMILGVILIMIHYYINTVLPFPGALIITALVAFLLVKLFLAKKVFHRALLDDRPKRRSKRKPTFSLHSALHQHTRPRSNRSKSKRKSITSYQIPTRSKSTKSCQDTIEAFKINMSKISDW